MAIDRQRWQRENAAAQRRHDRDREVAQALHRLRQVAVPLEQLTGSEQWDRFLRYGEALQEADRADLRATQEALATSQWIAPETVASLRHRALVLQVAIDARKQVLDLPKSIVDSAQKLTAAE
jgi:hypothetical protein